MVKKLVRYILRKLSKPIQVDSVRKILIIGSGNVEYLAPVIGQLRERYRQAQILLYPHSSYRADLPDLPNCKLVEFTGGKSIWEKLKFFWQLRSLDKDLIVSLWTGESQFYRFKVMAWLLRSRYHVVFNEHINHFQVSPQDLGLVRLHLHMRQGTNPGAITLSRMIREFLNLILFPLGVIILMLRVCWRLVAHSARKSAPE